MRNKRIIILANLLLGVLLIIYTFYVRLLKTRLPKDLTFLSSIEVNYVLLILVLFSIVICSTILLQNIFLLTNHVPKASYLNKFAGKITKVIDNALFTTYGVIANMIPDFYDKSSYICQKFYKYFKNKSETTFLFILYTIRLLIVLAFLIDVFLFFKLHYMYKCLFLLCISIIIKIYLYILKDFTSNLEDFKKILIIKDEGIDSETNLPITSYKLTAQYQTFDLEYSTGQFILLNKVNGYLDIYEKYSNFFTPRVNIVIYSLYLIGWLYVLSFNIINYMV